MSRIAYPPISLPFIILFFLLLIPIILLIMLGLVGYAFNKLGLGPFGIVAILVFSFAGSFINIPIGRVISEEPTICERNVRFMGINYVVPNIPSEHSTIIAINLGGALIPFLLSVYLLSQVDLVPTVIGIAAVTALVYGLARPVRGIGIAVPALLPPIITVIVTYALVFFMELNGAPAMTLPPLAYISGTMGTLIGADLLNLSKINKLCAPVVSIGGAGTFDGVFLTGLISVLLV